MMGKGAGTGEGKGKDLCIFSSMSSETKRKITCSYM